VPLREHFTSCGCKLTAPLSSTQVRAAFPDRAASKLILLGGGPNELGPHEEHTEELLQQLLDDGYSHVALSVGGYENWMVRTRVQRREREMRSRRRTAT
jgi:hypothetical protein